MGKQRSNGTASDLKPAADAEVFRAAVRDVKPLGQTPTPAGLEKPKPRVRLRKHRVSHAQDLDQLMPLIATSDAAGPASLEDDAAGNAALSFQRSGVRVQVMRRLKRGLCPIDSELDLHGLSQSVARDRLAEFLLLARDSGCRCVRIIHGKGYRSGGRGPGVENGGQFMAAPALGCACIYFGSRHRRWYWRALCFVARLMCAWSPPR